jgi:hypothetical protein
MIAASLGRRLPERYVAEPRVHRGSSVEVDIATFENDSELSFPDGGERGGGGRHRRLGAATADARRWDSRAGRGRI